MDPTTTAGSTNVDPQGYGKGRFAIAGRPCWFLVGEAPL